MTLGRALMVARELRLESGVSLPSTVVVTVTSSDAGVALVSLRPDQPGQSKISLPYGPNGPGAAFYVHGLANGTSMIAVTAAGMDDSSFLATVEPASVSMNRYFDKLFTRATADLSVGFPAMLRPGVRVSIPVRSSDPSVLEVESPAVLEAGNGSARVKVTAVRPGSAVISIDPPEGIVAAPTGGSFRFTVEDPPVSTGTVSRTFSVGKDHQVQAYLSGGPEPVTIRSSDASKLLIGTGPAEAGRASVTVDGTKPSLAIYFQALSDSGSATVTFSAPGYTDVTSTVNLCPSAFQFSHSSAAVSVGRTFDFQVRPVMACSSTNAYSEVQAMRGGLGRTTVDLEVDKPGVGTVKPASVPFDAGASSAAFTFSPAAAGSAIVSLKPPAGFVAPNSFGVLAVTVVP